MSRHVVIGTAGHIDHGKTELVRALTGTETDRLPEEKRRGITIDLGYAVFDLAGLRLAMVDVPGHEAFVRNMLAGATGIDAALVVVAADEGVMPQTREHVAILDLLGVRSGVVAVTKTDIAPDQAWLELVCDDVRAALRETTLAGAPLIPVSARTGHGIAELGVALATAAAAARERPGNEPARLPIDRIFTIRGTGTVVTGTLWSGRIRRDDMLRWMPHGRVVRVRGLETHGNARNEVSAGERVAIALPDLDRRLARRGDTLVAGDGWRAASILTVRLRALAGEDAGIHHRQRVRVHLGTAEALARVAMLEDAAAIGAGKYAWAQLRLETPIVARAGDHFVVRAYSPVRTIGGGMVAEPWAPKRRRALSHEMRAFEALLSGDAPDRLRAAVTLAGEAGLAADEAAIAARIVASLAETSHDGIVLLAGRAVAAEYVERLERAVLEHLERTHARWPMRAGAGIEELRSLAPYGAQSTSVNAVIARLVEQGSISLHGPMASRRGFLPRAPAGAAAAVAALEAAVAAAGLAGSARADLVRIATDQADADELIDYWLRTGKLVRLGNGTLLGRAAFAEACRRVVSELQVRHELGAAELKVLLGVPRRQLIPLLERMDELAITQRSGAMRRRGAASTGLEIEAATS